MLEGFKISPKMHLAKVILLGYMEFSLQPPICVYFIMANEGTFLSFIVADDASLLLSF